MSISKSSVGFGVVLVLVVTYVKQSQNLGLGLCLEFDKLRCWMGGGGGQTFYVGGSAGHDGDEEMDVSVAKILVSEASKLFAGARISRGP